MSATEIRDKRHFDTTISDPAYTVIYFYSIWCPACVQMDPQYQAVAASPSMAAFTPQSFFKVNAHSLLNVARGHGIQAFPTLVLYCKGKEIGRLEGACSSTKIKERLSGLILEAESGAEDELTSHSFCIGLKQDEPENRLRRLLFHGDLTRKFRDPEPSCVTTLEAAGLHIGCAAQDASQFNIVVKHLPEDRWGTFRFMVSFMGDPTIGTRFTSAVFCVSFQGYGRRMSLEDVSPIEERGRATVVYNHDRSRGIRILYNSISWDILCQRDYLLKRT
ncbi:thioredoxin-like protein [Mycena floridula]|nr:thioredoxin-like protein [Mycena floridula]